jgi:hypothetical protein
MITWERWQDYLKRSGDDFQNLLPGYIIENENGFCTYVIENGIMVILQLYGIQKGDYWRDTIIKTMKQNDCKKVQFFTKRNPEVYMRWFDKLKVHGTVLQYEENE